MWRGIWWRDGGHNMYDDLLRLTLTFCGGSVRGPSSPFMMYPVGSLQPLYMFGSLRSFMMALVGSLCSM